ncbi:response regulator transcription factor [Hahella sp. SMD15-11]|uniref:Response regulator transcription factor n=1 Tax=Thermohahella caldifontis TaxID=3142973 RepID=A0AB39UXM8_9GAMM
MNIALLEDDPVQAGHVQQILEADGHRCDCFETGGSFLGAVTHDSYDLLIMDWQLPDEDGVSVLRELRHRLEWPVPVLFLTQRESEADIVTALDAGADDYMVKPPRAAELKARIRALTRRLKSGDEGEEVLTFGPFTIYRKQRRILLHGESLTLTDKDFDLTLFLFENKGRLLSRKYLLERIWGVTSNINTRTVDTHMSRLRRKLGIKPENGFRIKTIYQHGYRLEDVHEA